MSGWFLLLPCFVRISELITNSVDPDQMAHSAASDLSLHCLPMSLLLDARHKWVKVCCYYIVILSVIVKTSFSLESGTQCISAFALNGILFIFGLYPYAAVATTKLRVKMILMKFY